MEYTRAEVVTIDCMRIQIRQLEWLNEENYRELSCGIVAYYRRHPEDQEWIALELTRKNIAARGPLAQKRVAEILAMLDHVHDPLIAGYDEAAVRTEAEPPAAQRPDSLFYPSCELRH